MQAPIIHEDIWGDKPAIEQAYYTVQVYKHTGLGNEKTYENVLADSADDACSRVTNSYAEVRTNPKYAYKQMSRI